MDGALELSPTPQSVGQVRRVVSAAASEAGAEPASVELAAFLASEIATNVVLHARTPYEVSVVATGGAGRPRRTRCIRVAVTDRSPALPATRRHRADATTGRGLRLLAVLAADHGVEVARTGAGKTVWFEVPLRDPAPLDEGALLARYDDLLGLADAL